MDYAEEYCIINKKPNEVIAALNSVRKYKKAYLLCKLVGMIEGDRTAYLESIDK